MTALDMVVIAAGLFFGYRLVSNYLSPHTGDRQGPSRAHATDSTRQDWEQHWASPTAKVPAWFDVLGVAESADVAEIERAYRVKMSQYHPDKVAQLGEDIRQLAEAKSKEINAAYDAAMRLRRR
jgi:DnaJ-domain-containing protein 1